MIGGVILLALVTVEKLEAYYLIVLLKNIGVGHEDTGCYAEALREVVPLPHFHHGEVKTPAASDLIQQKWGPVPLVDHIEVLLHVFRHIRLRGKHSDTPMSIYLRLPKGINSG